MPLAPGGATSNQLPLRWYLYPGCPNASCGSITGTHCSTKGFIVSGLLVNFILQFSRGGGHQALFLITDGYSNGGDPRPTASLLRDLGVEIFTFGIRNGNVRELEAMASEPKQNHTFILDSFEEFEALARRALHQDVGEGAFIPQTPGSCQALCASGLGLAPCCEPRADCACGTHTGNYVCLCPAGYYGRGTVDEPCTCNPITVYLKEATILLLHLSYCSSLPGWNLQSIVWAW